ncbi:hypothetical protein LguiB_001806 [Lonicera macranthoides]
MKAFMAASLARQQFRVPQDDAYYDEIDFVKKLLIHKRELANSLDALWHSPLHLDSGGGYSEIVRELIKINPEVCHFCDEDGKIPLHFASFYKYVDIMNVYIDSSEAEVG